jgi:cysteine desulfurase / selenocysteine lyase
VTTSDHRIAGAGGSEALEVPAKAVESLVPGANAIGILAGIDPGAIEKIASSVFSAMRGTPNPGAAIASPPVPEAIPAAMVPGTTTPSSRPETPLPSASAPGAVITAPPEPQAVAASVVPGISVPVSRPGANLVPMLSLGATASEPFPGAIVLPPVIDGMDGGVPRILDGTVAVPVAPAASAPGYYFLKPPSASDYVNAGAFRRRTFDVRDIRRDFPILSERVHGRRLIWLDNAATTHKPRAVIDRLVHYYEHEYSNVHRGAHELAARSTNAYEDAREKIQHFLGASSASEIVFVRGTTEAINLVAGSWGRRFVEQGDEILLTTIEHHSNIVPWQLLAETVGATIRVVPVTDRGEMLLDDYAKLLNSHTRLVALTHVSNALGTILPIREMVQMAHRYDARVLVDGAQAVSHFPVNVQELDADFYALSGHKMFGPSGVGVLYAKRTILDEMPPWQGGGNMIQRVTFEKSTYADPPGRFEAGTATLGPAVGLGAAVDYLQSIGMENVARHEHELLAHGTAVLSQIPGLRLIGTAPGKAAILSFVVNGIEAEEIGKMLDLEGIAVRAGHHCAQPTMDRFGVTSTVRPSLALYNTHDEIDELARCVRKVIGQRRGNLN